MDLVPKDMKDMAKRAEAEALRHNAEVERLLTAILDTLRGKL